jgi:serine acetyltransferase
MLSSMLHINATDRPLIFLGSNYVLEKYTDLCRELGIQIHGIIDSDYYGNTESLCGIPVIDSEDNLNKYKDHYNFFCATNWSPQTDAMTTRNRQKRQKLINLLTSEYSVISLIDPTAKISLSAKIGRGVYIDCMVMLEPGVNVGDFVSIYSHTCVGHHSTIHRNVVLQRQCSIAGQAVFEANAFLGVSVKALKTGATFGANSFIHECIYIRRGTIPDEVVGINGNNMSRVYNEQQRQIE